MQDKCVFIKRTENGFLVENPVDGTIHVVEGHENLDKCYTRCDYLLKPLTKEEKDARVADIAKSLPPEGKQALGLVDPSEVELPLEDHQRNK